MNIEFNRNEDAMKLLLSDMRQRLQKIYEGGGKKAVEKQKEKNKLTPRQRIEYLTDKDKPFIRDRRFCRLQNV
jgi:acetyl-CoA carboxylase carboxyltransferase component